MKSKKTISIIIPVYNEIDVLPNFFDELFNIINRIKFYNFQLLIINDGSNDESLNYLKSLKLKNNNISIIDFSKNFGKEAALTAGIDNAIGEAVIPIDCDLQDPPSLILELIREWEKGFDIVEARRIDRNNDTIFKKVTANFFHSLLNLLTNNVISKNVGDYRLISKEVILQIKKLKERNRYMKGLLSWPGFNKTYVEYKRLKRSAGKSKFNLFKLFQLALDGITSFSVIPLKAISLFGIVGALTSIIFSIIILFQKFFLSSLISGYAFLIMILLFFGSLQLISLGIIGEYIGKIYFEVKQRPIYIIKKFYK